VRVLVQGLERVLERVLEQVLVQVLEQALGQVPGLHIRRPPVRLTGPLSLPKKIIFYSISSSFKKWDLNQTAFLKAITPNPNNL